MTVVSDDKHVASTPRYVVENTCWGQYWPEGDMAFHKRITIPTLLLHGMKDEQVSFVEMCEMEKVILYNLTQVSINNFSFSFLL